jgi:hypothetical protein
VNRDPQSTRPRPRDGISPRLIRALALPLMLTACSANGDYGRLKDGLVDDDIHAWVGRDAARDVGRSVSSLPLTDEERTLRDLAYPLIEPPYDRNRWYAIVNEYGISHAMSKLAEQPGWGDVFHWPAFEIADYGKKLLSEPYRSATARYSQLNTDVRNDALRVPDFFAVARRVLDLDQKRRQSFAYIPTLSKAEKSNAIARMAENELVIGWAQRSLVRREQAYCWALQRLVVATPAPIAVEAERSMALLHQRITDNWLIASPNYGPRPILCGQPVAATPVVSK